MPSSSIIITATAVIGFDIDARRKIPSWHWPIGFDVDEAMRFEMRDAAVAHDYRDGTGDRFRIDVTLHRFVNAPEPLESGAVKELETKSADEEPCVSAGMT